MSAPPARDTILIISQVYLPDPAGVGQHLALVAERLAARGRRVVVLTSARGYEDPSTRYPRRERVRGVEIRRLPFSSFGKQSRIARVVGAILFLAQAIVHGAVRPGVSTVIVSTSPPMAPLAALVLGWLRDVRIKYWVMDLNPDQAIAMGVFRPSSPLVTALAWLNRRVLARAEDVVVMDRFMAERLQARAPQVQAKLEVIPPGPLEEAGEPIAPAASRFRAANGLDGKFVVMYSGNHSPAHPVETLLRAAARLQQDEGVVFVFVGGGIGKREVEASGLRNVRSLPYQPRETLTDSLSAADVHVVIVGDAVVGMVHPSKVYGAMAVARPVLLFGPPENHVADLMREARFGLHVGHGDVDGAVEAIRVLRAMSPDERSAMGQRGRDLITQRLNCGALIDAFCDVVERPATRPPRSG